MVIHIKTRVYNFLRKSEKYFRTDMVYLTKGGSWLILSQIVYALSAFFLTIAFAHFLPKEVYGTYKYVIAIAAILVLPSLGGMNTAIAQSIARGNEGDFFSALRKRLSWGMIGGAGSLFLSLYYFIQGNTELSLSFAVIAPFIPFYDSLSLYLAVLQGRKRFDISVLYSSASQIIAMIILVTTIIITQNLFIILIVYFVQWIIIRAIFQKITITKWPLNQKTDAGILSIGTHLSLINIFPLIAQQMDKIILFHYVGPLQLAIYSLALAIPEQVKSMVKNLQIIILPKFSIKTRDEIHESVMSKFLLFMAILGIISVVYWTVAPIIYKILFPKYLESIFYSQIYSISIIASVLVLPYSMLQAKLATKELYQFNILRSIIQIVFLCIGAFYFGVLGVIIARVVTDFANLGMLMILVKKVSALSPPQTSKC